MDTSDLLHSEYVVRDGDGTATIRTLSEAVAFIRAHPQLRHGNPDGTLRRLELGTDHPDDWQAEDSFRGWLDANDLVIEVRGGTQTVPPAVDRRPT